MNQRELIKWLKKFQNRVAALENARASWLEQEKCCCQNIIAVISTIGHSLVSLIHYVSLLINDGKTQNIEGDY